MRKLVSILVLIVFSLDIGGYFLWFNILQIQIQKNVSYEIENELKDRDLIHIVFSDSNQASFSWIKPDKEFLYKGEMYDVVKMRSVGQSVHYYCINDKREKQLIANFNKSHNSKKDADKRLLRSFYFDFLFQQVALINCINYSEFHFPVFIIQYSSDNPETHSPPPKSA
jgi:hypothetical protein